MKDWSMLIFKQEIAAILLVKKSNAREFSSGVGNPWHAY